MTAIVAANLAWSIELCDKAPCDLNYKRNTDKYGHTMKLTIPRLAEAADQYQAYGLWGLFFLSMYKLDQGGALA